MEIKLDTSIMQIVSVKAILAKDAVEEAMKLAETITVHNDWNCAERDAISESISTIRKNNSTICKNMAFYSNRVKSLAIQLDEFDRSLLAKFSGVDSSLGVLFQMENKALTTNATTQIISPEDLQHISLRIGENTYWNQYHITNINEPISVVSFLEVSDMLNGTLKEISPTDLLKEVAADLGFEEIIGG